MVAKSSVQLTFTNEELTDVFNSLVYRMYDLTERIAKWEADPLLDLRNPNYIAELSELKSVKTVADKMYYALSKAASRIRKEEQK